MIIAIDETGDFAPESENLSFFVAVLLEQHNKGLEVKKKQFDTWLATISKEKFNEKDEVKGSDLTDDELLSFVKSVYNNNPIVRMEVVCIQPNENTEELMQKFKDIEVAKLNKLVELADNDGKKEMAEQYRRMAIWHKNAKKMHYPHFLKLVLLRNVINKAFNTAIGVSILLEMQGDKKSENLLNLKLKIDQDFVRGHDPTIYWKELLRWSFISSTKHTPIPVLDTWEKTGHPFLEKYKSNRLGTLEFKSLFSKDCNFVESHEHFEIQIADIVGIIINRFKNRHRAEAAYKELFAVIKEKAFTKLILNPNPEEDISPEILD